MVVTINVGFDAVGINSMIGFLVGIVLRNDQQGLFWKKALVSLLAFWQSARVVLVAFWQSGCVVPFGFWCYSASFVLSPLWIFGLKVLGQLFLFSQFGWVRGEPVFLLLSELVSKGVLQLFYVAYRCVACMVLMTDCFNIWTVGVPVCLM